MSGIELRDGTLVVEREPNRLDTLPIQCSRLLDRYDVRHVFVAGYVPILAGRARLTSETPRTTDVGRQLLQNTVKLY